MRAVGNCRALRVRFIDICSATSDSGTPVDTPVAPPLTDGLVAFAPGPMGSGLEFACAWWPGSMHTTNTLRAAVEPAFGATVTAVATLATITGGTMRRTVLPIAETVPAAGSWSST